MARPGIEIVDLRAVYEPEAGGTRKVPLSISAGTLRVSDRGLTALLSPAGGTVDRIAHGRVFLRLPAQLPLAGRVNLAIELRPALGARGRITFELVNFHAGLLPVPPFVVSGLIAGKVRGKPGIHVTEDNQIQLDLAEVVSPAGIVLPAPRAIGADGGILEVAF